MKVIKVSRQSEGYYSTVIVEDDENQVYSMPMAGVDSVVGAQVRIKKVEHNKGWNGKA
jgi:hypothetical protein